MRSFSLLASVLFAAAVVAPSVTDALLLGTGNGAYYNPQPTFRVSTTAAGVDSLATFQFMALTNIPAGGSILVTIDTHFQTSSIAANTDCIATAWGMTPASKATGYQCSYQYGLLTIKGFSWIPAAQIVQFTINGIKNIVPARQLAGTVAISQIRTTSHTGALLDHSQTLTALRK